MYGGGMGELGVGRGQIELLAALFHPEAPNDVAPVPTTRTTGRATCRPARSRRGPRRPAPAGQRRYDAGSPRGNDVQDVVTGLMRPRRSKDRRCRIWAARGCASARRSASHPLPYVRDCSSQAPITASSMASGIPVLEVGDDHHVLGEAPWHRERLGEGVEQEISEVERRADDDVAVVELPRDQAPAIPPVEQPVAATLGDTVELGGEPAEVGDPHQVMVASQKADCCLRGLALRQRPDRRQSEQRDQSVRQPAAPAGVVVAATTLAVGHVVVLRTQHVAHAAVLVEQVSFGGTCFQDIC